MATRAPEYKGNYDILMGALLNQNRIKSKLSIEALAFELDMTTTTLAKSIKGTRSLMPIELNMANKLFKTDLLKEADNANQNTAA